MSSARTINLPGSGSDTQQYELAPGLLQYVQAVYVVVDNSAGAAAKPTLTVSEQSGVVIAKKRQGESIPAASSGSATWALRLTDEGGDGIKYGVENIGNWLHIDTTDTHGAGGFVLDVEKGDLRIFVDDTASGQFRVDAPFFYFDAGGGIFRFTDSSLFDVSADGATFTTDSTDIIGAVAVSLDSGNTDLTVTPTAVTMQLPAGGKLEVRNRSGNPIFRVNEDGSLQGLTGKALTFNL